MNLLFLTQTYPRFADDTAGPFIRDLARALVRGGDRVTVLAPHAPGVAAAWDDDGVAVRTFRYAPVRSEVLGYSRSLEKDETVKAGAALVTPLYALAARRAVRREIAAARRAGRPYDLLQGHWVVPNGVVAAAAVGRGGAAPVLAAGLHGSDVFLAERAGVRRAVAWALGRMELVTGCSPELVDRVCALGFPRREARVIPYGVDVETFAPVVQKDGAERGGDAAQRAAAWRRELGIPAAAPVAFGLGRMATKKGFQVLFEALPRLLAEAPDAHWVLAGAGDLLAGFRRRAAAMPGGERVHLPGAVLRDRLPDLFRAADLFVLPAVHDAAGNVDGLPNVILEAMATGLPVVATAISGIPLAVTDGGTGRLVPEGEPEPLAEALLELLRDEDRRRELGAAGRRRAVADLTWDAVAARYREGYAAALEG